MFTVWLNFALKRTDRSGAQSVRDFWERERRANSVRKKSLEGLDYIHIPMDSLPFGAMPEDETVAEAERVIRGLSDARSKIVNLTGISNTELKLSYGAANITPLSAYDQNYTTLVTSLQKWGQALYSAEKYKEAQTVLEFEISTRSDISAAYRLLCDIYRTRLGLSDADARKRIAALEPVASSLNSLSRQPILDCLHAALENS